MGITECRILRKVVASCRLNPYAAHDYGAQVFQNRQKDGVRADPESFVTVNQAHIQAEYSKEARLGSFYRSVQDHQGRCQLPAHACQAVAGGEEGVGGDWE